MRRRELLALGLPLAAALLVAPDAALGQINENEPATPDDREALRFLYDAEQLQMQLYEHGLTLDLDVAARRFAVNALQQERSHLALLEQINRERDVVPNRPRDYTFGVGDQASFLRLVLRVEDAMVQAYGGVIIRLDAAPIYIAGLTGMLADESVQAATAATLLGRDPVTSPFDDPTTDDAAAAIIASPEGP